MSHKPYLVGIAGGTCSGKSTLTTKLEELFSDVSPVVIHMDSYYIRPLKNTIAPITGKEYCEMNHPDALDIPKIIEDFNSAADDPDNRLVIVEGLFALYVPEIVKRLDLKVFVDLKSDERLVRRIKRHMNWGDTFEAVTDRYLDTVRFRHDELIEPTRWRADVVFNGMLAGKETEILSTYIRSNL
ncbi:MAG: uridine kinase [Clostridia bacterium]|nr:uridine kinase [Clostridia bacterium]